MLAAVRSAAVLGIEAYDVTVEVDAALGLPQWTTVGLPAGAVKESRERVTAALQNSGFAVPPRRITANLAPADIPKTGSAFDLPIAIALLVATGQLPGETARDLVVIGELGLDGTIRSVRGVLPVARRLCGSGLTLVAPSANVAEASLVGGLRVAAPPSLGDLVSALRDGALPRAAPAQLPPSASTDDADFADVVGQDAAKRALEVAAAGGHNILLVGPPGAGKTMLARRLATILPALTDDEALEVITIQSVAGTLTADAVALRPERPFRAPHHTISSAGLIGGGSAPRPGEVSLAHLGVLFLDELLEFPRYVLEGLRQPLEDGRVVIARAATAVSFPSRFTLVAATNPCPCGKGGAARACSCTAADISRYRGRLSGPLADRIDMHVAVGAVSLRALGSNSSVERSSSIRVRVEAARARQRTRYSGLSARCNAHVGGRWVDARTPVEPAARELLTSAAERIGLSARGYHRVLKVARTISDIDGAPATTVSSVAEALRYRPAVLP